MPKRDDPTGFFSGPLGMFAKQASDAMGNMGKPRQATKQQWNDNLAAMGSKPAASKPKPKAKPVAKKKVAMKPMKRGMKNAKKK